MTIDELYAQLLDGRAGNSLFQDIDQHLPVLKEYAGKVESILELGVRSGISTGAFLAGRPKRMVSVDISPFAFEDQYRVLADEAGIDWKFLQQDSRLPISTDRGASNFDRFGLIFFDTQHTRTQLASELQMHERAATHFLMFHDTVTFWEHGNDGGPGLQEPINSLLEHRWKTVYVSQDNNGLMILERV